MTNAFAQTIPVPAWLVLVLSLLLLAQNIVTRWQCSILRDLYNGYRADRDALDRNDENDFSDFEDIAP